LKKKVNPKKVEEKVHPKKQKEKRTVIPCAFYVFNLLSAKNYLIAVMWVLTPSYQ
jgi:hypothetical protein